MQKNDLIPVTLLTGYLGAGKTTLMNHILSNQEGYKVAVIVNDIGEVNIDASLIQKGGVVAEQDDSLVPLSNGCICCTLKVDLMKQLVELCASGKFDYILIEASGICEPMPIVQTITMLDGSQAAQGLPAVCRLDSVITVVDACRLVDEFGSGEQLMRDNLDEEDIENLLIQQIEFCNTIVINKVSDVADTELKKVKQVVRALQPKAKIIETDYAEVDLKEIFDTGEFDFEKTISSAGWIDEFEHGEEDEHDHGDEHDHHHDHHHEHDHGHHHHHHHDHEHNEEEGEAEEYGIGSFVYFRRKPFDMKKLEKWLNEFPANIIRTKGIIWAQDDNDMSFVLEQAGKQVQIYENGRWYASASKKQLEEFLKQDPDLMNDWDEKAGDRMIKLVFIGRHLDKKEIFKELDECLGEMQ